MTTLEQTFRAVTRLEKKVDKLFKMQAPVNEAESFMWENEVADLCRCKPSTIQAYKARGKFVEGEDFIKVGRNTKYKVSAVMRELSKKKSA